MFPCAYCKTDIEENSFYCDQCGKEILLCETCHQPRQGEWCSEDGGSLVAAKKTAVNTAPVSSVPVRQTNVQAPAITDVSLKLVNDNLGITLTIQHDTILGRTAGPYSSSLGSLNAISGKHLLFLYDMNKGWTLQDLGSSNGTKYHSANNSWPSIPKIAANTIVALSDKTFLLIGNVEFAVQITVPSSNTTQRI